MSQNAMNKPSLFAYAATFAPGLLQVRRSTWLAIGGGLLVLLGLLLWAVVAFVGWFFGTAQSMVGTAPEMARRALERVDEIIPGTRDKLGEIVPVIKAAPQPQRDVSGTDLGPVARYPGLVRTQWQREGSQVTVEYVGAANYAAVVDYYSKEFAALGFIQSVQSATVSSEIHAYTKDRDRLILKIAQIPKAGVSVRIETVVQ